MPWFGCNISVRCVVILCVPHLYSPQSAHLTVGILFLSRIFQGFCPPGLGLSTVILPILPNQDV